MYQKMDVTHGLQNRTRQHWTGCCAAATQLILSPPCRSKEPIQLNVWNTINLERSNRKGEIMVNKKDPVRGEAPVSRRAAAAQPPDWTWEGEGEGLFSMRGWG